MIQLTADGSHTVAVPDMQVTYHSIHGAVKESVHVFIEAGLKPLLLYRYDTMSIFEMGFGTGLNALLSLQYAIQYDRKIYYYTVELFPLHTHEYSSLNYAAQLQNDTLQFYFMQLHESPWEKDINIHSLFTLHKTNQSLLNLSIDQPFQLIYFDAFAPNAQPELWTQQVFEKMFHLLAHNGVLVTYCSKGDVRRAMKAAGFTVEKLQGPPGKREMIRAVKILV
ncbi:MAG TPA: tRNA (5-methylaminomethyl-2-thiouridine)(34)-methyltransferase MnmD [Chitinophagaceae bacterium]|nr:tRNA (5-methylaminomethyl-2-thiouridine)(34)-methyltransferase MnmD [Chitinophagaceae bacterium]